jgi:DnaJ-domain-containing protein 1
VELIVLLAMFLVGGTIAAAVGISVAAAQRESGAAGGQQTNVKADRNTIAGSILFNLLLAGGSAPDDAMRDVRRAGILSPLTSSIDISNWSDRFAQSAAREQRMWLLDTAVKLVAARSTPVPLRQYAALLDISFSLGFQTDALAKLRQQYGFDYVDHAKAGRPREADRAGGAAPLFARDTRHPTELLRVLGVDGPPSRQVIVAAYRKLVSQHHPDRVFGEPPEVQAAAAARFIEITRAYEALLAIYGE